MENVLENGLVGNGSDEDGAIQVLIANTPAGGTIYFPATADGYAFKEPIVITKSLTIRGDGIATIIESRIADNSSLFQVYPSSYTEPIVVHFQDFKITNGYRGIDISGAVHPSGTIYGAASISPQSSIRNVEIENFREIGIKFSQKKGELFLKDVRISSSLYCYFGESYGDYNQLYFENSLFEGAVWGVYHSGATNSSGAVAFNNPSLVNDGAGFVFENITYTIQSPTYINTPVQVTNSGSTQASSLTAHATTHQSGGTDQVIFNNLNSQGVPQGSVPVSAGDGTWTNINTSSLASGVQVSPADFNPFSASMLAHTGAMLSFTGTMFGVTASYYDSSSSFATVSSSFSPLSNSFSTISASFSSVSASFSAVSASYANTSASFAASQNDLDTHILDTGNPHATSIANLDPGTLAELNAAVSDADLISKATFDAFTGSTNAATSSIQGATGSLQSATASLQSATASLYTATGSLFSMSSSYALFSASHAEMHLSGGRDPIDAQDLRGNGLSADQVLVSDGSGGWKTVASQSVGGAGGGGGISEGTFNAFTSSTNFGTASVIAATASLQSATASLYVATGSLQSATASLQSATASLYVSTGSLTSSITRLNAASASFNSAITFQTASITKLNAASASFRTELNLHTTSITRLNAMSSSYNLFSASHGSRHLSGGADPLDVQSLRGNGLSINQLLISNGLGGWTTVASQSVGGAGGGGISEATFNAYTGSTNFATSSIQSATGSLQSATASLQAFTASIETNSMVSSLKGITGFTTTNYLNVANGSEMDGNNATGFEVLVAIMEASGGFKGNSVGHIISQRSEFGSDGYYLGVNNFNPESGISDGGAADNGMTNSANWLYSQNYRLAFLSVGTNLTERRSTLNGEEICRFTNDTSGYTSSSNGVSIGHAAGAGDGAYSGMVAGIAFKTTGLFTQSELEKLMDSFLHSGSFDLNLVDYSFSTKNLTVGSLGASWTDETDGITFVTTGSLSVVDWPFLGITEQNNIDVDRLLYRSTTQAGSLLLVGYQDVSTTGPTTISAARILADSSAAAIGLTCPSGPDTGASFEVVDIGQNASANNITITRAGSQLINGQTTYVMNKDGERAVFVYDGNNGWTTDSLRRSYVALSASYNTLSASYTAVSASYNTLSASYLSLSASYELNSYIKTGSWGGTAFTMSSADNGYFWRMTGAPVMWITTSIKQGTTAEFQRKGASLTITGSQQVALEYDSGTFAYSPVAGGINSTIVVSIIYSDTTMTTASLRGDFGLG